MGENLHITFERLDPVDAPLHRSKLTQALLDALALIFLFLFLGSVAFALPLAIGILLFL